MAHTKTDAVTEDEELCSSCLTSGYVRKLPLFVQTLSYVLGMHPNWCTLINMRPEFLHSSDQCLPPTVL